MITKQDLLEAIAECQGVRSPNANTAVKLASFYTILDHLDEEKQPVEKPVDKPVENSFAGYSLKNIGTSAVQYEGESEFAQVVNGKDQGDVWPVLDELMSTIKLMNERLYNGVMRRLS